MFVDLAILPLHGYVLTRWKRKDQRAVSTPALQPGWNHHRDESSGTRLIEQGPFLVCLSMELVGQHLHSLLSHVAYPRYWSWNPIVVSAPIDQCIFTLL